MKRDLNVHVGGGFESVARRVARAWHRAERGERVSEDHLTYVSWDALASVMTVKRMELLRHLRHQPEASVASLARSLKRDYKRVHTDVEALSSAGLIERGHDGLRADYDEIRTVIALG